MRILGFSKKWDKLNQGTFTTFRFPRKDKDWYEGESAQIVYKPRSKNREILGTVIILSKEKRWCFNCILGGNDIPVFTRQEAMDDGFRGCADMEEWLESTHGDRVYKEPLNKLTLRWIERDIEGD